MIKVDKDFLQKFELELDTTHPDKGDSPVKMLGFGEISIVIEILHEDWKGLALKRVPIFDTVEQVERHIKAYNEYNNLLREKVGLNIPDFGTEWVYTDLRKKEKNPIALYCIQKKFDPKSVAHHLIHQLSESEIEVLVQLLMRELHKVWKFNYSQTQYEIGIDGQISNWILEDYEASVRVYDTSKFWYCDTSTPLYRVDGNEAMEAVLFLKSAPKSLRWVLKALFLEDTVNRYYDMRLVTTDLIANFYKEQRPELIPRLIQIVNDFFEKEASEFGLTPLNLKEIKKYYRSDANMWRVFQAFRKMDRATKKIFGKRYDFYLPSKIKR
ncbi:MAG: hypothetical protein JW776_15695 [Candidatus Lokiarchaeota archaeon]|nr:hypothetical protein [Candidatus Lokiarchaeota archaeon]